MPLCVAGSGGFSFFLVCALTSVIDPTMTNVAKVTATVRAREILQVTVGRDYFWEQVNAVPFFVVPIARFPCFLTGYVPPDEKPLRWI
jgi:hypothetical protein